MINSPVLQAVLTEPAPDVSGRAEAARAAAATELCAEIATKLAECTLAVVMGTAGYGEHTKAPLSLFRANVNRVILLS